MFEQISYVEKTASTNTIKFFRTQSPRHFEGGDWNEGGSCPRVEPLSPAKVLRVTKADAPLSMLYFVSNINIFGVEIL